jgi:hypothetical protein
MLFTTIKNSSSISVQSIATQSKIKSAIEFQAQFAETSLIRGQIPELKIIFMFDETDGSLFIDDMTFNC